MNVQWGLAMATIGGLFFFWGRRQSEFVVYQGLAARSRILWGDRVHSFCQVVGAILVVLGLLWAIGVIW